MSSPENKPTSIPANFCINPFVEINVKPAGSIRPCCAFGQSISKDDRTMSVYEHSVEEIWNSDHMRDIRKQMVEDKPIKACVYCTSQERDGAPSMRTDGTKAWLDGWLNPEKRTLDDIKSVALANDFSLPAGPEWVDLDVGNLCNLKCRMCNATSSSSIASDPVHSKWAQAAEFLAKWAGRYMIVAPNQVLGFSYTGIKYAFDKEDVWSWRYFSGSRVGWIETSSLISMKGVGPEVTSIEFKFANEATHAKRVRILVNDVLIGEFDVANAKSKHTALVPDGIERTEEMRILIETDGRIAIEEVRLVRSVVDNNKMRNSRLSEGRQWFQDPEFIDTELLGRIGNVKKINLIGGEPLLIKEVLQTIRQIVARGAAKDITLSITTNGTTANDEFCELASKFKSLILAVSVDGVGAVNEYIRSGSNWEEIVANIRKFQSIPNAYVYINMTVQAYNMMHITDVARFCEEMGLDFRYHFLVAPPWLSCLAMPEKARQIAADRLRAMALQNEPFASPDKNRYFNIKNSLLQIATILEQPDKPVDEKQLSDFMLMTNDLDVSRNETFDSVNPELRSLIVESGVPWNAALAFATSDNS